MDMRHTIDPCSENRRSDDVKGMTLKEIPESSSSESSDSESSPEEDAKYSSEAKGEEEEVMYCTLVVLPKLSSSVNSRSTHSRNGVSQ